MQAQPKSTAWSSRALSHATGSLVGLRPTTTQGQIARASFEGVVCGLLDALDALEGAGVDASGSMHLVGGGARSPVYRQVLANLSGRVVHTSDVTEHVALGACVQAAAVLADAPPSAVRAGWTVGSDEHSEPADVDRGAIRAAYHRANVSS
jgi:xylulokinase